MSAEGQQLAVARSQLQLKVGGVLAAAGAPAPEALAAEIVAVGWDDGWRPGRGPAVQRTPTGVRADGPTPLWRQARDLKQRRGTTSPPNAADQPHGHD